MSSLLRWYQLPMPSSTRLQQHTGTGPKVNRLRKQGIVSRARVVQVEYLSHSPQPIPADWRWINRHLNLLGRYTANLPPDAFVQLASRNHASEFRERPMFTSWITGPYSLPYCTSAVQKLRARRQQSTTSRRQMQCQRLCSLSPEGPVCWLLTEENGGNGEGLFNPGFSAANMLDLVTEIV